MTANDYRRGANLRTIISKHVKTTADFTVKGIAKDLAITLVQANKNSYSRTGHVIELNF